MSIHCLAIKFLCYCARKIKIMFIIHRSCMRNIIKKFIKLICFNFGWKMGVSTGHQKLQGLEKEGLTLTGMDTMMVGLWVGPGKSHLVKMHYVGPTLWVGVFDEFALSGQKIN